MKKISIAAAYRFLLLFILSLTQALVWAQDSSVSSTTKEVTVGGFVIQPWMWIAGGVVLLLLLVAILSGKSKKEVAVTKTTVIRETEIK